VGVSAHVRGSGHQHPTCWNDEQSRLAGDREEESQWL
jgi:hypothetical protein